MSISRAKAMDFIVQPGKAWAERVARDWLEGCGGGRIVRPGNRLGSGPAALYGVAPDTMPLWSQVLAGGRDYYYLDNAYFGAGHAEDKYLRVSRNALQCSGRGRASPERFAVHGLSISPWRGGGRHILVTCQSEWWYEQHGTSLREWLDRATAEIREYSDRPIRIRLKPFSKLRRPPNHARPGDIEMAREPGPFLADLDDCWALVTHSSNTAVEAILEGVPVFVTGESAAAPMACSDLASIESPRRHDGREQWAWNLAANQWTPREIRNGTCWRALQEQREPVA